MAAGTRYALTVDPSGTFVIATVVVQAVAEQVNVVAVTVGTTTESVEGKSERLREYCTSGAVPWPDDPANRLRRVFAASDER